jgi:hypothetical protein
MRLLRGFRVEGDASLAAMVEGARRRDGVVTRVRKVAAVSLMTPMAAAALAVGLNQQPADAVGCPPLASASITAPTGTVTAGSSVHATAKISGLMLLQAHLQISGPGLDKQVGNSVMSGEIKGDVVVPKPGYFTLAVVGNGTKCTYQTAGFSVKEKASAAKPTHSSVPSKAPRSGGGGSGSAAGAPSLPTGSAGNGAGSNFGLNPLNGASPFSLPSVAPDGSSQGFQYPSPDPQVASPPSRPVARNVSETTPIKWGQSLAIALVLLVISAHFGMWSRRQRLAAEGARSTGGGKRIGRKKSRKAATMVAQTSVLTDSVTEAARRTDTATPVGAPTTDGTAATDDPAAAHRTPGAPAATAADRTNAAKSETAADSADATDDVATDEAHSGRSAGRNYHGRRRRG